LQTNLNIFTNNLSHDALSSCCYFLYCFLAQLFDVNELNYKLASTIKDKDSDMI
ncbi:27301_t:CDS:2, partial [Dentiscutata erythropus]